MTYILLLFGLGLILILAEVLIPSMGMLGILASLCVVGSIAWAFTEDMQSGLTMLFVAAVLVPGVVMIALKILPHSPLTRKLMAQGFTFDDGEATDARDQGLLGARGVVEAPLRPAGMARIDGRRVDVVSRGELIEAGTGVRVIEIQGNRVLVARDDDAAPV